MKIELGTLFQILNETTGKADELAIVKIDQANRIVVLEHQQTHRKVEMSFEYFSEKTGVEMDNRQLLQG